MSAQIVLENAGIRFPNRVLFERVNWTLYDGMRVALAGRNGSGKSTLLRILAGKAEPTEGKRTVVGGRKLHVGYLDQTLLDTAVIETLGVKDRTLSPVAYIKDRLSLKREETSTEEVVWETKKILGGLGFSSAAMDSPIGHLSGGWLLRMFIGAALLDRPEVLLLDEPTNHLDISSIQWLEEYLKDEYKGSLILVTHDVALQSRTTDSLAVLHGGNFFFRDHQRDYLTFRNSLSDEQRHIDSNIETLKKKIDENMEFVEKFRAKAQTASRAQSKLKLAEKLTEELRTLQDRLERVKGFEYNLKFRFRMGDTGSKFPISLKQLSFRYRDDGGWILSHLSVDIRRGQRVAIMGDNGAGKTTLLNIMGGRLNPSDGKVLCGQNVSIGYFGQHQLDEIQLEASILENLLFGTQSLSMETVRGWLGAFGFVGNDTVSKKARFLSGGERARLALLRILVTPANVVLLDEPTNHLDIETKELLKRAMREFEGTLIFVSHDREFVGAVAERILFISQDHQLTDHLGNLESFYQKYPQRVRHLDRKISRMVEARSPSRDNSSRGSLYEERKKWKNQARSLERRVELIEREIDRLGEEKIKLERGMGSPEFYEVSGELRDKSYTSLSEIEQKLRTKMIEWERWSTELERIKKRVL